MWLQGVISMMTDGLREIPKIKCYLLGLKITHDKNMGVYYVRRESDGKYFCTKPVAFSLALGMVPTIAHNTYEGVNRLIKRVSEHYNDDRWY